MKKAIEVKPLDGYRIWLKYADGVSGEIDLSHLADRGVFKAWSDRKNFESVHVDTSGAVAWVEEIDLCPDALYLRLTGKAEDVKIETDFETLKRSARMELPALNEQALLQTADEIFLKLDQVEFNHD